MTDNEDEDEGEDEPNQYGGGTQDTDAVEQTEKMMGDETDDDADDEGEDKDEDA